MTIVASKGLHVCVYMAPRISKSAQVMAPTSVVEGHTKQPELYEMDNIRVRMCLSRCSSRLKPFPQYVQYTILFGGLVSACGIAG